MMKFRYNTLCRTALNNDTWSLYLDTTCNTAVQSTIFRIDVGGVRATMTVKATCIVPKASCSVITGWYPVLTAYEGSRAWVYNAQICLYLTVFDKLVTGKESTDFVTALGWIYLLRKTIGRADIWIVWTTVWFEGNIAITLIRRVDGSLSSANTRQSVDIICRIRDRVPVATSHKNVKFWSILTFAGQRCCWNSSSPETALDGNCTCTIHTSWFRR